MNFGRSALNLSFIIVVVVVVVVVNEKKCKSILLNSHKQYSTPQQTAFKDNIRFDKRAQKK